MKRLSLISAIAVAVMLLSLVAPVLTPRVRAQQPPVIIDTFFVGTIGWGPRRADPVRAYDTGSGELIFNVYDALISMKGEIYWEFEPCLATNVPSKDEGTIVDVEKTINSTDVNLIDPTGSTWDDGSKCIGWVDNIADGVLGVTDVIYLIEPDGSYRTWQVKSISTASSVSVTLIRQKWIFHIRTADAAGNPIYFVDEGGSIVDTFDVYDAEYSFKRGLVQDQLGSPMWMFYKPLFDQMNSDPWDTGNPEDAMILAHLIDNAIEVSGNDLIINLGILFPEIAFKQILSQTWASMVSKQFSISIGCWNGDLYTDSDGDGYPDWWTNVRRKSRSPYDATTPIERPPGVYFTNGYRYVGTGPYRVITFDGVNYKVEFEKNPYYWKGWTGKHVDKVVIRYIADDDTRINAFLAGEIDVCAVPRAKMQFLLDPTTGEPIAPGIITIKKISPALSMDALHFTFTLALDSPYIPKRTDTGEPLPFFFNNTHVRKAFCYAFDHAKYIHDAWFDEAIWRNNMLVYGLVPDYYDPTCGGYDKNVEAAINELKAVVFPDGKTLYDAGFTITLAYNEGNTQRQIACEMIQSFFQALGSQFVVDVVSITWDAYLDMFESFELPIWSIGWLADFADADNFARPYMHSYGDFAYFQNYTYWNGWGTRKDEIIDAALKTPDGPARAALYKELQTIYYNDAPFLPISIPIGRRWCWYWVKGWYYNALYPAQYYYSMYKENTCWYNIAGAEEPGKPGIPDAITNLKDTVYLINHFMAKAPEPGKPVDPRWVGTYGVGGVDPYGDRICNLKDVVMSIVHFNHKAQP
ncbi:MAG: ABC transporter substrate-binding protein [Candidatus Bathyarchaeia archaeon]